MVDVFAFGILAAAIFNYEEPYDGMLPTEVMAGVLSQRLRPELPECLVDEVRLLHRKCGGLSRVVVGCRGLSWVVAIDHLTLPRYH